MLELIGQLFTLFFILILLPFYIYFALVFVKLAKRTGTPNAWLAWIPLLNLFLIAKIAQFHWWPIIFLILGYVFGSGLLGSGTWLLILGTLFSMVFGIFSLIWIWKIFVRVGRPGWWTLFLFIPGLGFFIYLVLLGMAAWGRQNASVPSQTPYPVRAGPEGNSL